MSSSSLSLRNQPAAPVRVVHNSPNLSSSTAATDTTHLTSPVSDTTIATNNTTSSFSNSNITAALSPPSLNHRRKPNWAEFYKNGVPREIIVIHDDDDGDDDNDRDVNDASAAAGHLHDVDDVDDDDNNSNNDNNDENRAISSTHNRSINTDNDIKPVKIPSTVLPTHSGSSTANFSEQSYSHATKRRRTSAYDSVVHERPSALHSVNVNSFNSPVAPASHYHHLQHTDNNENHLSVSASAPVSVSPERADSNTYPSPSAVSGDKRKRSTRRNVREDLRRKELETTAAANPANAIVYVPPEKPIIKSREVKVPVIMDKTSAAKNAIIDDKDGHFIVVPNADLAGRYKISRLLGQGTFGKVVEAYDKTTKRRYAIKIIRAVPKYRQASRVELRVLDTLSSNDRHNRNRCLHLRSCFDYRNHICIVTDLLSESVFDFLEANTFLPFPNSHIQSFARQLFTSVAYLHDLNLIHTDLKPENILLTNASFNTFTYARPAPTANHTTKPRVEPNRKVLIDTDIRLIDFGSAAFNDEHHSSVVSTRHYRAPEIILNLGWSFPCDIWSIGCILVEFFTGDALFRTHDNLEHLTMMENICGGKLDSKIVRRIVTPGRNGQTNSAAEFFNSRDRLNWPNETTKRNSRRFVKSMKKLPEIIPPTTTFNKLFLDLLRRIFVYDPNNRITAKEALAHPWFKECSIDDGTQSACFGAKRKREREADVD